jgi:predicted RNA-binding protein with PUA-like domain
MPRRYWLFKTEPTSFSFADLERCPQQTTCWDGVRNYQARNMLRDAVQVGDHVLVYHSRVAPMAVVGLAEVVRAGYPDPSQFDPTDDHFDPGASPKSPRWVAVDIRAKDRLQSPVRLSDIRQHPELSQMVLLRRNSRLSVQPVSPAEFRCIVKGL